MCFKKNGNAKLAKLDPCQQQPRCCSFLKFWNSFTSKKDYASPKCCPCSSHQGGLNAFPTWCCFWWRTLKHQAVQWATERVVEQNWWAVDHNCYKWRWDPPWSWWKPSAALPCSLHLDQDPTAAGSEQCAHGLSDSFEIWTWFQIFHFSGKLPLFKINEEILIL